MAQESRLDVCLFQLSSEQGVASKEDLASVEMTTGFAPVQRIYDERRV